MKNYLKTLLMTVALAIVLFAGVKLSTITSEAATTTEYVQIRVNKKNIQHIGDYYFKYAGSMESSGIYYSKSKTGTYKKTPLPNLFAYTNGKIAYYVKGHNTLCKYSFSTGLSTKVKVFSLGSYTTNKPYYTVRNVYNGIVYLAKMSVDNQTMNTYVYNIREKTTKKIKSNCQIVMAKKNYAVAAGNEMNAFAPKKLSLVKLGKSSVSTIKTLATRGMECATIGSYFYYVKYNNSTVGDYANMSLYKIRYDGSALPKKIANFSVKEGSINMYEVHSTYCIYIKGDANGMTKLYKYNYSTKKATRIYE